MADKLVVQVGLAPTQIRLPVGSLENQTIVNAGPSTVYLGQAGVTVTTGFPFPPGSEARVLKNGQTQFACSAPTITWAAAPSLTASPSTLTNTSGQAVAVTVTGGTVSAIAVAGVTQAVNGVNTIAGTFVLAAGATITITYTVAPTVLWQFAQQSSLFMTAGVQQT